MDSAAVAMAGEATVELQLDDDGLAVLTTEQAQALAGWIDVRDYNDLGGAVAVAIIKRRRETTEQALARWATRAAGALPDPARLEFAADQCAARGHRAASMELIADAMRIRALGAQGGAT